jgi:hypothetical protein
LLFACAAASARVARADATATEHALAESLFQDGLKLEKQGKQDEACKKYEEAIKHDTTATGTLYKVAVCHEREGLTATAWTELKEVLARAHAEHRADREKIATAGIAKLEPKLSHLTIEVPSGSQVDGLSVMLDGVEVGKAGWGSSVPIDPGDHSVTANAPQREAWSTHVTVKPDGDAETVSVPELAQSAQNAAPAATAPASSDAGDGSAPSKRTIGWIAGGVGAAGLLTAIVTGLMISDRKTTYDEQCKTSPCASQEGLDAQASGKTLMTVNAVAWVLGAAGLGVGAYFLLTPAKDGPQADVHATAVPGGGAVRLRVSF